MTDLMAKVPSHLAGAPHRRVRWKSPAGGKRRPGVVTATCAMLVKGLEKKEGSLWCRICRIASIAGYPLAKALHRVRALRADGTESMLAMAVAMLYLTDVQTGFVGKPRSGGGRWQRYTLRDLAQLAFGGQKDADLRRARRALDVMGSLGWLFPTKQVRRYVGENTWRSEAGVRRLNLDRLCEMTGTTWLLKRDRRHAERSRGARLTALQEEPKQHRQKAHNPRRVNAPCIRPQSTEDTPMDGPRDIRMLLDRLF